MPNQQKWNAQFGGKAFFTSHAGIVLRSSKLEFVGQVKHYYKGQMIVAKVCYDKELTFTVICIYAPVDADENVCFWKWFATLKFTGPILVLGDMNCVLNTKKDNYGTVKKARKETPAFQAALNAHDLIDGLENNSNSASNITRLFKQTGLVGKAGTRINFILYSAFLRKAVKRVQPYEYPESDYFPLTGTFVVNSVETATSYHNQKKRNLNFA
ncbi:hypothetical protein DSO57_1032915 [Entomophthora muscae]|uniref:Uncharacterized protein n=1 Tax=Entomophthora muscae TaxID=34485 RepID=A0ACC2TYX2_9FUNG|nr:hypothetical protein DSO57_1032915 [Entomophthora muscae]